MSPSNHILPNKTEQATFTERQPEEAARSPDTLMSCDCFAMLFELGINCNVLCFAAL